MTVRVNSDALSLVDLERRAELMISGQAICPLASDLSVGCQTAVRKEGPSSVRRTFNGNGVSSIQDGLTRCRNDRSFQGRNIPDHDDDVAHVATMEAIRSA